MAQVFIPDNPREREQLQGAVTTQQVSSAAQRRMRTARRFGGVDVLVILALLAAGAFLISAARWSAPLTPNVSIDLSATALPLYAGYSLLRMLLAYVRLLSQRVFRPLGSLLAQLLNGLQPVSDSEKAAEAQEQRHRSLSWRRIISWVVVVVLGILVLVGLWLMVRLLVQVDLPTWGNLLVAALATWLRTLIALVIGVAWTVPLGVAIGLSPRWSRRLQPVVQIIASIPATALFPLLLLALVRLPGGLSLAAILLMLLGTQWYLLFNVIAGAMAIPGDLREATTVYHVTGWRRWRTLLLPAIFPYLVTGLITASGGAWNASIVSEYVQFNSQTVSTVGLGASITPEDSFPSRPTLTRSFPASPLAM